MTKGKRLKTKGDRRMGYQLLADGGSTKVEWVLKHEGREELRCYTTGLNPVHLHSSDIIAQLRQLTDEHPLLLEADTIEFYGSGCTPAAIPKMKECLQTVFQTARTIIVDSDIIGAAKSLCGSSEGIACILGTGANSCLWDGHNIIRQTPALGYILGDEGSGAVLGKLFVNAIYKGQLPQSVREDFEREYNVDMMGVIEKVYRQPLPNRWLASLSVFVYNHLDVKEVECLVESNLDAFICRNILPYSRPDLPVSFVGSIAYYYQEQLKKVLRQHDLKLGKILKTPL